MKKTSKLEAQKNDTKVYKQKKKFTKELIKPFQIL